MESPLSQYRKIEFGVSLLLGSRTEKSHQRRKIIKNDDVPVRLQQHIIDVAVSGLLIGPV